MTHSIIHAQVPDHEHPEFFVRMDRLIEYNTKISEIGKMGLPSPVTTLLRLPFIERMVAEIFQLFIAAPIKSGSVDVEGEAQVVY